MTGEGGVTPDGGEIGEVMEMGLRTGATATFVRIPVKKARKKNVRLTFRKCLVCLTARRKREGSPRRRGQVKHQWFSNCRLQSNRSAIRRRRSCASNRSVSSTTIPSDDEVS